jgi:hypothetical protein
MYAVMMILVFARAWYSCFVEWIFISYLNFLQTVSQDIENAMLYYIIFYQINKFYKWLYPPLFMICCYFDLGLLNLWKK